MNSAAWERIKEIFHAARELPPNEREVFLTGACGGDGRLRREIEALLESDRAADDFIADPPARLIADAFGGLPVSSDAGRMIGQYQLRECIGAGGMGAVYRADRADQQFQMQVAIKLIKRGMDTDSVLRRFQHERQILASLEHPNIARLLDGGTTEDGLPYFVMECIEGQRIDRYVEEHWLTVKERLELFRQICGAVSYAHQHLVVHRDLKPSNILVTANGVPKLLDFGIAKITQTDEGAESLATMTLAPILTPEYASPEQIEGVHATTQSDVYSLGVVLYEMLTGNKPYRTRTKHPEEMARAIREQEPTRPSENRESKIDHQKSLRGDLDNIVLMALRKETARRYRSVEQFSEDIRRHLDGRPVIARADTWSYRAGKFVHRNRVGLAAAILLLLTLVGGIVATGRQARRATMQEQRARAEQARAERRFNDVRKLANNVLFDYHDAIKDLPGSTKVRERLVKDALNYLDSLAGEAHGDPELQRELAGAYERVGDVRGGVSTGNLGDLAGAVESYMKAFTIREALVASRPGDAQARRDFAGIQKTIGERLLDTRDTNSGYEHLRKARMLYLDLTREHPANDELQLALADTSSKLGRALWLRSDLAGALEQFRAAVAICERLAASHPQDAPCRRVLWITHERVADLLLMQGDVAGAIETNGKALALGEALLAEDPLRADYRRGLVQNYKNGGYYRRQIDRPAALEYYRKAAALDEELLVADPANAATRKDLGFIHKVIGDQLAHANENSQALVHLSKARAIFEKATADAPGDLPSRFRVASCGAGLADMQIRLGQVEPALEEIRKSADLLREISEDASNTQHRSLRAEAYEYLAYAYQTLAELPQATATEKRRHITATRDTFQECLNVLDDLRKRGLLDPGAEPWAKQIAGEIAKCDTALGN